MKPITVPLPLLGLNIRIEAAPASRRRPSIHGAQAPKPSLSEALPRRLLRDIGLDRSRAD